MTIQTYFNGSPNNKIGKTLTAGPTYTGQPRENTNIVHPDIRIDGVVDPKINYAYISDFGRYYFIRDIEWEGQNVYTLHMDSDPLETFKNEILGTSALIARTSGDPNDYLVDNIRPIQNNYEVITSVLTSGRQFNKISCILATVNLGTENTTEVTT